MWVKRSVAMSAAVLCLSGCGLGMGDPGPPGRLGLTIKDDRLTIVLPTCATGRHVYAVGATSGGNGSLGSTLWRVEDGPPVPASHQLVVGDTTGYASKVVWVPPSGHATVNVYVVLGNYDLSFEGTFSLDKVGSGVNGGRAFGDADISQADLDADDPCS